MRAKLEYESGKLEYRCGKTDFSFSSQRQTEENEKEKRKLRARFRSPNKLSNFMFRLGLAACEILYILLTESLLKVKTCFLSFKNLFKSCREKIMHIYAGKQLLKLQISSFLIIKSSLNARSCFAMLFKTRKKSFV